MGTETIIFHYIKEKADYSEEEYLQSFNEGAYDLSIRSNAIMEKMETHLIVTVTD